ncbi:MAG: hypothetical protein OXU33_12030 [Gemmatimonadota bacterium]|nr:hypothetical protein [Gemmatimonadota bacterium]MDE3005028.1 hypothetical protein [Gemmatimonadota bacterium]MDE3014792.1 hypothetical protein [Gemmatimonadota bacterium]
MKLRIVVAVVMIVAPMPVAGQGFGLGAHAGFNGFGADAGVALSSRVVLRGGLSVVPDDYFLINLLPADVSGIDYEVLLPQRTLRLGLDLHILGPLRLMGGVIHRNQDLIAEAMVTQSIDIGGTTYTQSGMVQATLDQSSLMPFGGIGFGNLSSGFGLYLDIGVAYSSEAAIVMSASGELATAPGIDDSLQQEADEFFSDAPPILKHLYPLVQIGLKFGL